MTQTITRVERERLLEIAAEYERKGYSVIVEPRHDQLPATLAGFAPGLVASNNDEHVVVEVRGANALRNDPELVPLAETIAQMPQWRLELAVLAAPHPFAGTEPLSTSEIRERIAAVREAGEMPSDFVLVLAWIAIEATLRRLAARYNIDVVREGSLGVVQQLAFLGIVTNDDYTFFREAYRLRNAVVHGFRVVEPVPHEVIRGLVDRAEAMLRSELSA